MAIPFDISLIERKLDSFQTKEEKLNYLDDLIFKYDKKLLETETWDLPDLERLIEVTKEDHETLKIWTDQGNLVYWNGGEDDDELKAKSIGIKNVELLKRRYRIENELKFYNGASKTLKLLKSKISPLQPGTQITVTQNNLDKVKINVIWLNNPKISIEKMVEKCFDVGIVDESQKVISEKGSLYGTGKTLLAALYIALKGNSIKENIDYKVAGESLCNFFKAEVKTETKEPYKSFQNGDEAKIKAFKTLFGLS